MNVRSTTWIARRVLTLGLLCGPLAALLSAGEPIQFSGARTTLELPSGRETVIPSSISINLQPNNYDAAPAQRVPVLTGPQLSLRDQIRLKEFIHEQQNWMFYDPHILSGKSALDEKSSLPLTRLEQNSVPMSGTMQMLFGKPSDSSRPVIPLVRTADDTEFKSRKTDFQDPLTWPADRQPGAAPNGEKSGHPNFFDGSTATRSMDRPESTLFDILNPGGRGGASREQLSRRASFNELLTPTPAPAVSGGLGPINLSGDTTRQPFNSGSGLSRELPTASHLGSVLDPMQAFSAGSRGLRSSIFDDPNARYINVAPAPATAARQIDTLKMLRSPTVSEFPTRKF